MFDWIVVIHILHKKYNKHFCIWIWIYIKYIRSTIYTIQNIYISGIGLSLISMFSQAHPSHAKLEYIT